MYQIIICGGMLWKLITSLLIIFNKINCYDIPNSCKIINRRRLISSSISPILIAAMIPNPVRAATTPQSQAGGSTRWISGKSQVLVKEGEVVLLK